MWKQKLGISLEDEYSVPMNDAIGMIAEVGFDAISPVWYDGLDLDAIVKRSKEAGLEMQSLHAPFNICNLMWRREKDDWTEVKTQYKNTLDECIRFDIPVMVVHTWVGFEYTVDITAEGLANFEELVSNAEKHGIKIAFENTEGEEYLEALMDHFKGCDTVGFCWDSGHEMCYNHSKDLLAKYGDRLYMTHLNDNLGISFRDGRTFWTDDLHLLPYDGVADWEYNIRRLKKSRKQDTLNVELRIASKPGHHNNEVYADMPLLKFLTEAHARACRIAYRYSNTFEL